MGVLVCLDRQVSEIAIRSAERVLKDMVSLRCTLRSSDLGFCEKLRRLHLLREIAPTPSSASPPVWQPDGMTALRQAWRDPTFPENRHHSAGSQPSRGSPGRS